MYELFKSNEQDESILLLEDGIEPQKAFAETIRKTAEFMLKFANNKKE